MRKWCPEPFDRSRDESLPSGECQLPVFQESPVGTCLPEGEDFEFQKDLYPSDRLSPWDLMNQVEKDRLLEKSRQILQAEFDEREYELQRRFRVETAEIRGEFAQRLENWSREATAAWTLEKHHLSVEAAGLALALAQKIIRATVKVDPEFISRTLETAQFKIQLNRPLTAVVHPDDAVFLTENPDLMKRLRIETVFPDRRVEKGGCRLRSGDREWDATLSGQMDALTEVVEDVLATVGDQPLVCPGGEDDSRLD